MDISNDKLNSILSDPESLQTIARIAGNLLGTQNLQQNTKEPEVQKESVKEDIKAPAFNNIPAKHNYNNRIGLLNSLKPYVNNDKQQKIDSLVKALYAARVIENYKNGNDFMNFINGIKSQRGGQ